MAISTDTLLFYGIPKTGSTWCGMAMRGIGGRRVPYGALGETRHNQAFGLRGKHTLPAAMPRELRRDRFEFCFVRQPVAWLRSFWCGCHAPRSERQPVVGFPLEFLIADTFEEFCRRVLCCYPEGFVTRLFQLYVGQTGDALDFVGRQEHLAADFRVALRRAHAPPAPEPESRIAASATRLQERACLSAEMEGRVLTAEHWVIETFY